MWKICGQFYYSRHMKIYTSDHFLFHYRPNTLSMPKYAACATGMAGKLAPLENARLKSQ